MSRSEDIDNAIWDDSSFCDLTAPAKLVYIWSWTNRRCDFSGIYQVPVDRIVTETNHTTEDVRAALVELQQAELVFYDGTWLWCKARVKRIRTRTVQMCKAIAKDLAHVPAPHPFREQFMSLYGDAKWSSKEDSTTIRVVLDSLSGGSGVVPADSVPEPIQGSDPSGTRVVPMTGTRTGTGTWPRGQKEEKSAYVARVARSAGSNEPSAKAQAFQPIFPGIDLGQIDSALCSVRLRRLPETAENVAAMLGVQLPRDAA